MYKKEINKYKEKGGVKVETMVEQTKNVNTSTETRTAATVYKSDLKVMKEIAQIKFNKDPMNSAWKEAVKLFIAENEDIYLQRYEELKKSKKE